MLPPEVTVSLLLLLTGAEASNLQVSGVVGHSVTLPCSYTVASGAVTSMCWGRGACPMSKCSDEIIWTNGSHVTVRKHVRYQLKGHISQGNVSLTIENVAETDSGLYCCRIEHRGWFNDMKITLSLDIQPATDTSVPMSPRPSTSAPPIPARTQTHKPVATSPSPTQAAGAQPTTLQKARTQATSPPLYSCPTDGNGTMTQSSDGLWHNNQTQVSPAQSPWLTTANGLYVGITVSAVVLLVVLAVIVKKYFHTGEKMQSLSLVSLNGPQIGALQSTAEVGARAEDNIYVIEDNLYVMD